MYGQRDHSLEEMKDIIPAMDRQKFLREKDYRRGGRLKNCIILLKQSLQETKGMEAKQVDGIRWRLDLLSACDASQWFAEVGEVKGCSWDNRTIVL